MKPFELTPQDKAAFETFGFLSFPGLLAHRAQAIIEAFEAIWTDRGGGHDGKPHNGQARSCIVPFIDQSEYLSSLLDDPAIDAILTGLLGPDYNYMGSDGNYYVGDSRWHSDGWYDARTAANQGNIRFTKIAFYLDPLTRDTGALRVIPGSHMPGSGFADRVQADIGDSKKNWNLDPRDVPCVPLETRPGDVVVFNFNIKHASFGGGKARRMFTINCCRHYPDDKIGVLREIVALYARFWIDSLYGPQMLRGPASRQIHLQQVLANQDHLPALAAKARLDRPEPARG